MGNREGKVEKWKGGMVENMILNFSTTQLLNYSTSNYDI